MAFPIIRDPKVVHLFVDKFKDLLDWWFGDSDGPFYDFCEKNLINEVTLFDTWLLSSNSNYYLYDDFIGRSRTEHFIYEIGAVVNVYDPITSGQEYLNYIISYNNFQTNPIKRIDRITLKNDFWNLETSSNPLKNSTGYLISTIAGNATANITGGLLTSLFQVGDMVKVTSTGEYRQVLTINPTSVTFDRPFSFTTNLGPSSFEVRNNKINETYAIDLDTFIYRIKAIKNLAYTNNLKVDAYIPRSLTQVQLLKIVQYFDKIYIENDYDQYSYSQYNDGTQTNTVRDVLIRSTQNRTGTVFINGNSDVLHGTGTNFNNDLCVGGKIVINDKVYKVLNITNSTVAQLDQINTGAAITNANFRTYVEFLPIFHIDKQLRQDWLLTDLITFLGKSYQDVFRMFTLSGYTVGGTVQPTSPTPVCYNLETNPNVTGSTELLGISVYGRYSAQLIDPLNQFLDNELRNSATNPLARLTAINTTFGSAAIGNDCTCDNAVNGSASIYFNSNQPTPITYTLTNGSRVITIVDNSSPTIANPFIFNGLGTSVGTYPAPSSGTWTINITDGAGNTSTNTVTIIESFQPTLTGFFVGPTGAITGNLTGGYQNYFIATLAAGTTNYDNVFFVSNLPNGNYGPGAPFNTLTPGSTYDFIIGDTDGCIKIFRSVRIPTAPTGLGISLSSTNPPCTGVNTGTITAAVSGPGVTPYTYYFYPPTGSPIISAPTTQTNYTLNTAYQGLWRVVVVDSTTPVALSAQSTVTLTNAFAPQINTPTNNSVCFVLQAAYAPYSIVSTLGPTPVNQTGLAGGTQCLNSLLGGAYNFTVTANNGCSQQFNVIIPTAVLTLNIQNFIYPSCPEVSNGVVNLLTLGGSSSPPLTYSATNGTLIYTNTTGQFTNLSNDIWTFTVRQGVVTAPAVVQDLRQTRFNVIASSTGGTICISASGGSTGFYTVEINGTLYPYNTSLSANCYTATCGNNNVRVVDGDIINTNISGCVYTNIIKGNCNLNFNYTANTVTCGDFASIFVRAVGGLAPYVYTVSGSSVYSNIFGNFPTLPLGTWEIIVKDSIGNSASTITTSLDNRLNFSASTELTGTCVTISNGLPPFYILVDDVVYTASTNGTYCFSLSGCGYHGVNVYDSCPDSTCVNYVFTRTGINPITPTFDVRYVDCYGVTQQLSIDNTTIGAQETACLTLGGPLQYNNFISAQITGFCPTTIGEKCYDDNSQLVFINCPLPLDIDIVGRPFNPSCSGNTDGFVMVTGVDGRQPYVSYSAVSGSQIFTNGTGIFNQLSSGVWTFYVQDSDGSIATTNVTLTNSTIDNVQVTFSLTGDSNIQMCVIIDSLSLPNQFQPPFTVDIYGNQFFIPTTDTEYCFTISGVTGCSVINYSICGDDQNSSLRHSFSGGALGGRPYGSLLSVNNGIFYGMTNEGGSAGKGLIFSSDTNGNYGVLTSFNGILGAKPTTNSLIQGSDGNLYGMTTEGGANDMGVVFRCTLSGNLSLVYEFGAFGTSAIDGYYPLGDLVEYSNGKFFGLTSKGGTAPGAIYGGTIFSCDTSGNYEILFEFGQGNTGDYPCGSPTLASNGRLYGTTLEGGQSQNGVIFNFNPSTRMLTNTTFNTGVYGTKLNGTLFEASDDYLYLVLSTGGNHGYGTLLKYGPVSTNGNTLTAVHHFGLNQDGKTPTNNSKLLEHNGKLYGTTSLGGVFNKGIIFTYDLSTNDYRIIYSFKNNFYFGQGTLIGPISDYIYGMTPYGGVYGQGTIYKLNIVSSVNVCCFIDSLNLIEILRPNPIDIYGAVIGDGTSNVCISLDTNISSNVFYTVNVGGVNYGYDVLTDPNCFEVIPYSATVNVNICKNFVIGNLFPQIIHDFDNTTGGPSNGVIEGNDGNLYGICGPGFLYSSDTSGNFGVLSDISNISISPTLSGLENIKLGLQDTNGIFYGTGDINGGINGVIYSADTLGNCGSIYVSPYGTFGELSLIEGSDGYLYGYYMTITGGIFKINKITRLETILHYFLSPFVINDGRNPKGKLLEASDGFFYGMTSGGGDFNGGIIFRVNSDGTFYEKIHDFESNLNSPTNGANPGDYLIELGTTGILYGVTTFGGGGGGTIFTCNTFLTPPNNFSILHSFISPPWRPTFGLLLANNGLFYGTIYNGTSLGYGAIFSVDVSGNVNIVYNFDSAAGAMGQLPDSLTQTSDGTIYGTTRGGGANNNGVLYKLTSNTELGCCYDEIISVPQCLTGASITLQWINNLPHVCVTLNTLNTSGPYEVTIDGVTTNFNLGVLPNNNQITNCYPIIGNCNIVSVTVCEKGFKQGDLYGYRNEYLFSGTTGGDGFAPLGDLMLGYDGIFYGMTNNGGTSNKGTIFKFDPLTKNYQVIHSFNGTNGAFPSGTLQMDENYNLYGVTERGGSGNRGVLFRCNNDGSNFTIIHTFTLSSSGGYFPTTLPSRNRSDGKFYRGGSTKQGPTPPVGFNSGGVYTFNVIGSNDYSTPGSFSLIPCIVQYFNNPNVPGFLTPTTGYEAIGPQTYIENDIGANFGLSFTGVFAGMAKRGGNGFGTIYSYDANRTPNGIVDIFLFDGPPSSGAFPSGGISSRPFDSSTTVYGMTEQGGSSNVGTIFSVNFDSTLPSPQFTLIHSFIGGSFDGEYPTGSLLYNNGRFYGMTKNGGSPNEGTIFSFDPSASPTYDYNLLYTLGLGLERGSLPFGSLTMGPDGKLYGMTSAGGNFDPDVVGRTFGLIFSIDDNLPIRGNCCYTKYLSVIDDISGPQITITL